jgi:hypothetical protein
MVRLNLATRPFYNERGVHILLALVAVVLAVVTVLNARQILNLSARHTAAMTQLQGDRARAQDARQRAERLRAELKQDELERVLADTREANALIDQRTFSWTELFNRIESTLPSGVMLRAVQPNAKDGRILVTLGVIGRRVDDIDQFMERLEQTGAFSELLATSETPEEDGTLRATLVGVYVAGGETAPATAPPAGTSDQATAVRSPGGQVGRQ